MPLPAQRRRDSGRFAVLASEPTASGCWSMWTVVISGWSRAWASVRPASLSYGSPTSDDRPPAVPIGAICSSSTSWDSILTLL